MMERQKTENRPTLSELKNVEEKIQLLSAWRASGELDGFSDSEKKAAVIEVAQILEEKDNKERFKLACRIFDLLIPSGRTDFSHRTFADYLVSVLDTLGNLGYPKAEVEILNILSQSAFEMVPRVNPAELFKIFARLKLKRKHVLALEQSLPFMFDDPELSEIIKQDILETIETDEIQAIFCLKLLEEIAEEEGSNLDYGAPPKMIKEILKAVEFDERSALTRRIVAGIYRRLEKNEKKWRRGAREYGPKDEKPIPPEKTMARISKDFFGIFDDDSRRPTRLIKKGRKKIVEFEDLDAFKKTETDTEQIKHSEEASLLFRLFLQEDVFGATEKDFSFPIRDLTLREQIWFVNSLKNYRPEKEKIIMEFTKKFGLDGARAFLSCEYGDKFRETVLSIGEKLPEELARQVFKQYGKLALLAQEKSEELIREFTAEGKELKVSAAAVEQELLRRAKDFLAEVAVAAEVSPKVVAEKMARHETDMVVFAGIFRAAFKGATEVNLEEIRGLKLESQTPSEILPTDKTAMMDIFTENWREQKPESAEFLARQLKDKLAEQTADSKFYLLKKDGKLIAFVCFDAIDDIDGRSALYGKSFNIKKDLRGSAIGEAIMKNTVDAEAAEKTIIIDVFPELIAGTKYVEDFGFTLVGVKEFPADEDGKTETRFIMKRDDRAAKAYRRKKIKPELFDLSEGTDEMTERVKAMAEQGFVGTKYFADPENKNLRYIVFEPAADVKALSKAA